MSFKLLEILGCLLSCGLFLSGIIQWRKKYFDIKGDYDILLSEMKRLSEENQKLKGYTNTDPVK